MATPGSSMSSLQSLQAKRCIYLDLSPKSVFLICPLVWHRYPEASWWSDLPPLPNQLVSTHRSGVRMKAVTLDVEATGLQSTTLKAAVPATTKQVVIDIAVAGRGNKRQAVGLFRYPAAPPSASAP